MIRVVQLLTACVVAGVTSAQTPTLRPLDAVAASSAALPREVPAGVHRTGATLRPPADRRGFYNTQGWTCLGQGQTGVQNSEPFAQWLAGDHASVIRWVGEPDGVMVRADGSYWEFGRMTLLGWRDQAQRDALQRRPGCDAALLVRHRGATNGAKSDIHNLSVAGCETAIRIGEENAPGNDNNTIRRLHVAHCGSAIEIVSRQAMATRVDGLHAVHVDQLVLARGGLDVACRNVHVDSSVTLLKVVGDGYQVGPNNGRCTFDTIKVDLTPNGTVTLVNEDADAHVSTTVRGLHLPAGPNAPRLRTRLRGKNSRLLIDDAENLPKDTRFEVSDGAAIVVTNSTLLGDPAEWLVGDGVLVVRDCWRGGTPVNLVP